MYGEEHVCRECEKYRVHRIRFGNPVTPPLLYLVCLTRPGQTIRHFRQGEIYRGGLTRSLLPPSHTCQPSRPPGAPPTTFGRPPKWFLTLCKCLFCASSCRRNEGSPSQMIGVPGLSVQSPSTCNLMFHMFLFDLFFSDQFTDHVHRIVTLVRSTSASQS